MDLPSTRFKFTITRDQRPWKAVSTFLHLGWLLVSAPRLPNFSIRGCPLSFHHSKQEQSDTRYLHQVKYRSVDKNSSHWYNPPGIRMERQAAYFKLTRSTSYADSIFLVQTKKPIWASIASQSGVRVRAYLCNIPDSDNFKNLPVPCRRTTLSCSSVLDTYGTWNVIACLEKVSNDGNAGRLLPVPTLTRSRVIMILLGSVAGPGSPDC